jgi:hypothetical protein
MKPMRAEVSKNFTGNHRESFWETFARICFISILDEIFLAALRNSSPDLLLSHSTDVPRLGTLS